MKRLGRGWTWAAIICKPRKTRPPSRWAHQPGAAFRLCPLGRRKIETLAQCQGSGLQIILRTQTLSPWLHFPRALPFGPLGSPGRSPGSGNWRRDHLWLSPTRAGQRGAPWSSNSELLVSFMVLFVWFGA